MGMIKKPSRVLLNTHEHSATSSVVRFLTPNFADLARYGKTLQSCMPAFINYNYAHAYKFKITLYTNMP